MTENVKCEGCQIRACETEGNTLTPCTCEPSVSDTADIEPEERAELHAHFESYNTDCDGPISSSWVVTMKDEEREGEYGDIEFHNRVVSQVVNTYSIMATGTLTVTRLGDGDVRISWHEPTDEGARNTEATLCTDPCDTEDRSYRDHRAEAMGY